MTSPPSVLEEVVAEAAALLASCAKYPANTTDVINVIYIVN